MNFDIDDLKNILNILSAHTSLSKKQVKNISNVIEAYSTAKNTRYNPGSFELPQEQPTKVIFELSGVEYVLSFKNNKVEVMKRENDGAV